MGSNTSRVSNDKPVNPYISNDKPNISQLFIEKSIEGIPTATELDDMRNKVNTIKMNTTMKNYVKSLKSQMESGYDFLTVYHDYYNDVDYSKYLIAILEQKGFTVEITGGDSCCTLKWTTSPPSYQKA